MPPHRSLRGAEAVGGGRTFDDGCRGVGGNWAIPTCSVGDLRHGRLCRILIDRLLNGCNGSTTCCLLTASLSTKTEPLPLTCLVCGQARRTC